MWRDLFQALTAQAANENVPNSSFTDRTALTLVPVLPGSSEHMRNEPTAVKSVIHGHGRLRLSW